MGNKQSSVRNSEDDQQQAASADHKIRSSDSQTNSNSNNKMKQLLHQIQSSVHNLLHPPPPPPPKPRAPKHMLWGCQTVEEHYETIRTHLAQAKQHTGEAGLAALGFQFRMAHHPERCSCDNLPVVELPSPATNSSSSISGQGSTTSAGRAYQDEEESSSACSAFFVPTGTPISLSLRNEASWSDHPAAATEETLSPNPFHINTVTTPTATTTSASASRHFSRVASTVSMFSLATHRTYTSNADSFLEYDDDDDDNILCCLRLFHVKSNTMITSKNHETFIAHGLHYDEIARLAMEYAQQVMLQEGGLEWYTTPSGSTLLQTPRNTTNSDKESKNHAPPPRNVLLVITGKGLVRAGIFSRRHILTTGIESATALPFLRQAQKRNMDTILLDPNAHGWKMGMQTVQDSLNELFGPSRTSNENVQQQHVYVLAHSMAGSQLVRYLKQQNDDSHDDDEQCLLPKIKAIAFTDSNHNINWTKDNPQVTDVLVGPASLYIKSHKVHEDAKALGEAHHDCDFWKHRFGTIRTLWAGTSEHALTNYTGRFPIWEHFDARMKEQQQEKHDENG